MNRALVYLNLVGHTVRVVTSICTNKIIVELPDKGQDIMYRSIEGLLSFRGMWYRFINLNVYMSTSGLSIL